MIRILCLLSCFGAVLCGGIGVSQPLLQYSVGAAVPAARTSVAYGNAAFLAKYNLAGASLATPLAVQPGLLSTHTAAYASPLLTARTAVAAPVAHAAVAAPLAHAAVAAPLAHAAVASPFIASAPAFQSVAHVRAVAQVPVTKYEAQPAVVQNVVDVANPKVATRKFEIRRPAIQSEFYDIEERVVVRPAGKTIVEFDQPLSKNQRGPTVVSPAAGTVVAAAPAIRTLPLSHTVHTHTILPGLAALPVHSYPFQQTTIQQQPIALPVPANPLPSPPLGPSTSRPQVPEQPQFDDSDSVSVENPEISRARSGQQQQQDLNQLRDFDIQRILEQTRAQAELRIQQEFQSRARQQAEQQLVERHEQQQLMEQARVRAQQATQRQSNDPAPVRENAETRSRIDELRINDIRNLVRTLEQSGEIPSVRNSPELERSNQARLISLLTERGPVTQLGYDGLGGSVRSRVISATPAPPNAAARDEQVNTRRVSVNRPLQTVQEVEVVEPFTKIERVAVHQPALIKTARLGVANVPTSLPVHTYTHAHYLL